MRIQHNIMAMNAYRNLGVNQNALAKNLEKLSSGYRINRAGDDAAGLAISEKMRAQITGLDAASKNVKDGISLVKTAEGALQEVHDMLNRMDYLATQSANGTYDNEVDRANLQKEVDALKSEIDRIADSSNFNGQKLLDGSLNEAKLDITGASFNSGANKTVVDKAATGSVSELDVKAGTAAEQTLTVEYADADGKLHSVDVKYTGNTDQGKNSTAIAKALQGNSEISGLFDVTSETGKVKLTSKVTGENGAKITNITDTDNKVTKGQFTTGAAAKKELAMGDVPKNGDTLTLNGKTYEFVTDGKTDPTNKNAIAVVLGSDENASVKNLAKAMEGSGVKVTNAGHNLTFEAEKNGAGLTLQIGDTADSYNQLTVNVGDMHTKALGLGDLDISTRTGAQEAIKSIKDAINSVSSTRGDLGAIQNRLEHTSNNLGVMKENIQDAESTIRDTDVADEMMRYTKNNILIQASQAMLAQANQVPQGVLQLLQ